MRKFILSILGLPAALLLLTGMVCVSDRPAAVEVSGILPKALFLTTGQNYGNGTLAEGVSLALQNLHRHGIPVRLENREILFDSSQLAQYRIVIALTASEYHDADRVHSLVYMSTEEMEELNTWVGNGGILVAGTNIGRYFLDGTDRAQFTGGRLLPENWALGKSFGVTLQERNLRDFSLSGKFPFDSSRVLMHPSPQSRWTMAVEQVDPKTVDVLAAWTAGTVRFPAVSRARYGRGQAILLATPLILHPSNSGGLLDLDEIRRWYDYLAGLCSMDTAVPAALHPWPDARPYALCVTLDAEGEISTFENTVNLLESHGIRPEFYVNAHLDSNIRRAIMERKFPTHSSGFDPVINTGFDYSGCRLNVLRNELFWKKRFRGNRFPNGIVGFNGLCAIDQRGYSFDNSIAVDNVHALKGTAVPYNIPLSTASSGPGGAGRYYHSSDLLEVSPIALDDYFYFSKLIHADHYPPSAMKRDAAVYGSYLANFLQQVVRPCKGVASYFGHVSNTGFNDITLSPLNELIREALRDTAWVTSIDSIAQYTRSIRMMKVSYTVRKGSIVLETFLPGNTHLPGNVSFAVARKPVRVKASKGSARIVVRNNAWYVVADSAANQRMTVRF